MALTSALSDKAGLRQEVPQCRAGDEALISLLSGKGFIRQSDSGRGDALVTTKHLTDGSRLYLQAGSGREQYARK
jgi:hypothetical protein